MKRSNSTRIFMLALLLAAAVLGAGCGGGGMSNLGPTERAERDALVDAIRNAKRDAMQGAFGRLDEYAYKRYIRTEQFDSEDFLLAYTEHVADVRTTAGERRVYVQQADSGGAFEFGFFKGFVSENVDNTDPVNLVPYVLPDDPGYLDPRHMDKYTFRELADTLLWDRQARVIEARARPDYGDGLNVRRVRHYIDRGTDEIVAMSLERIDLALLFREESSFYIHVRPLADGAGLPYNTRFESRIRTPFRGSYKVRTVSTYTDFVSADGTVPIQDDP